MSPAENCTFRGVQEASWEAQDEPRGAQDAFRNMQDGSWGDQGRVPGRPGHVPGVWNASRDERGSVLFLPERVSYTNAAKKEAGIWSKIVFPPT